MCQLDFLWNKNFKRTFLFWILETCLFFKYLYLYYTRSIDFIWLQIIKFSKNMICVSSELVHQN